MTGRAVLITLARNNGDPLTVNGTVIAPGETAVVATDDPVVDANRFPTGRLELEPNLSTMDPPRHRRPGLTLPAGADSHYGAPDAGLTL